MTRERDLESRPRTRGDCLHGLRPCPWIACRHHLAEVRVDEKGELRLAVLDDDSLPLTAREPHVERFTDDAADAVVTMRESCSLDVADRNPDGTTLGDTGRAFELTRERMRQIEYRGLVTLRRKARRLR